MLYHLLLPIKSHELDRALRFDMYTDTSPEYWLHTRGGLDAEMVCNSGGVPLRCITKPPETYVVWSFALVWR